MVVGAIAALAIGGIAAFCLKDWLSMWFLGIAADMLDEAIGMDSLNDVLDALSLTGGPFTYDAFWGIVNKCLTVVEPFGYALITTYFLMYIFDAAAKDQVTVDSIIKVLIQLVLVVALISNLDTIVNAFLSIGESILQQAKIGIDASYNEGTAQTGEDIINDWFASGEDTVGTIFFQCFFLWLLHKIANIAICFAVFTRLIEVGWRTAFAPVGVANCFEGGANSKGIQYLKTLFVVCLSGAVIFVVAALGFALVKSYVSSHTGTAYGNFWMAAGAMLATAGAAIGVSNKIRDLA